MITDNMCSLVENMVYSRVNKTCTASLYEPTFIAMFVEFLTVNLATQVGY